MSDDCTIADIALWPLVLVLGTLYDAGELLVLPSYPSVERCLAATKTRPAREAAQKIPAAPV
jgi:glutathione S-transferase